MDEKIINQLKEFRVSRGYTQEELADAVGVSRQSINAIERGRYTPSLPLALKFARTFNCSIEDLFQLDEEK
jgi:putative transcriptional regulator